MFPRLFDSRNERWLRLLIAAVPLIVFVPFLWNTFVSLDDNYLIYKNPFIQGMTPGNLWHVFTSYDPQLYIPLTFVSYQMNYLIGGLHPFVFHFTNLLLHIANALLVFSLLKRLTDRRDAALLAALLFAIHPLQTEAVLWASAREDVLSAFFFLSSIHFYLRYWEEGSLRPYYVSLLLYVCGLLSKVSVITLPLVLILLDWKEGRPIDKESLREKIPYFLFSVLFGIVAVAGKTAVIASSGFQINLLLWSKSIFFYIYKMLWPAWFSIMYPQIADVNFSNPQLLLAVCSAAILLISAAFFLIRGNRSVVVFAAALYLLLLVPNYTNTWKNTFLSFASDRYAYLASIAIFLLISLLLSKIADRKNWPWLIPSMTLASVLILAPLTFVQSKTWVSSETMYRNVLQHYPDSAMAHNNLGLELEDQGRADEALAEYLKSIELDPRNTIPYFNVAGIYGKQGKVDEALREYEKVIDVMSAREIASPAELQRFFWLADKFKAHGRYDDAEKLLSRLLEIAPQYPETRAKMESLQ